MAAPTIHEVQLSPLVAFGTVGGPMFQTTVVITSSGTETRIPEWGLPRFRWEIRYENKHANEGQSLAAFFIARQGKAYGFRFKDPADYGTADPTTGTQTRMATLQLTTTTFQLQKQYTSGGVTVNRPIYKPVSGTVAIFNGSTPVVSGWTVDTTTGIVTFSVAPGYVPNATFEFDVPARFDTDEMKLVSEDLDIRQWESISVVELLS